ncbi:MAG: ATP-dependent Clp protease ATP-binding subunit [Candidatus Moraniibacteriota bacterium]|nr:MAG: ATP-dependent Clp protease ATP-binding subunit [Candidatus Moranbacteria bacterium]
MNEPDFFEKLSINARRILRASIEIARNGNAREVDPKHLLMAILLDKGSLGNTLLEKFGIKLEGTDQESSGPAPSKDSQPSKEPSLSKKTRDIIASAFLLANRFSYPYVGSEHFVHALIEAHDPDIEPLLSLHRESAPNSQKKIPAGIPVDIPELPGFSRMIDIPDIGFTADQSESPSDTPTIREYGVLLGGSTSKRTCRARSTEVENILRTLGRKTKSNPLLIGDPGIGKTTIVEIVADRLSKGLAGPAFRNAKVVLLDLPALVAGTSFRGEFEARLKEIVREAREHPNVILFLDEIHTIVGAGNASGGLDAANILKPALSRGDIRCIGATTFAEYKRHIEKDPALERRFQPIRIAEPSAEATLSMLEESRRDYESHHHITIGKDALRAAVALSIRHMPARFLPDKAFDLLDEAASLLRRRTLTTDHTERYATLSLAHEKVSALKNQLVKERNFEEAKTLRAEEASLENQLRDLSDEEVLSEKTNGATLSEALIAETVALMTETPIEKILNEKNDALTSLFPKLSAKISGQETALKTLSRNIIRSQLGLKNHANRPSGSFLFLGPSGVGKTLTAKTLAETLFATKHSFLRFDMSEFRERHTMAQMIGSPAGYVGFGEGGKLTEHIRRHPASVILFDEIEKAHPDVLNLLLQILEEGILTDAEGRQAHFRESIIILTSNIGTESFLKEGSFGFGNAANPSFESLQEEALRELKRSLRPELLARLDHTIVFRPLDASSLSEIAAGELSRLADNMKHHAVRLRRSPTLAEFIGEKSSKESGGARAVRNIIGQYIEDPIADLLIAAKRSPKSISLSVPSSRDRVTIKATP